MTIDRKRMKLFGWGWTDISYDHKGRDEAFYRQLSQTLDVDCSQVSQPPINIEEIPLPDSKLTPTDLSMLEAVVGKKGLVYDRFERLAHAYGKSLHDLVRIRKGIIEAVPDAVVYPVSTAEVSSLIELAREKQWSLVPFGGGSSVVGGVEASDERKRPVITLDTTRLEGLVSLDLQSRTATFGAGTYGPAIERELNPLGLVAGSLPAIFRVFHSRRMDRRPFRRAAIQSNTDESKTCWFPVAWSVRRVNWLPGTVRLQRQDRI